MMSIEGYPAHIQDAIKAVEARTIVTEGKTFRVEHSGLDQSGDRYPYCITLGRGEGERGWSVVMTRDEIGRLANAIQQTIAVARKRSKER